MSPPIPTTISRSSLTLQECPPELAAELAYFRQDIAFEDGHCKSTPVKVSYAHYDPRTRVCRTYPNALHLVQKKAEQLGLEVRIIDRRILPELDLGLPDEGEVPTVCFRALKAVTRAKSSGLIVTPVGRDRMSILCGLVCLMPMHYKVLVTTEEKPAVNLIHGELTKALRGETIGIHNKPVSNPARIIVTDLEALKDFTQGELAYSGYALREFDIWICDEVHRLPEPSRFPLLNHFRTVFSWGLTATLERADNSHQLNRVIFGPTLFQMGDEEKLELQQSRSEKRIAPVQALVFPLPAETPIPLEWPISAEIRAGYLRNAKLSLLLRGIDAALPEFSKVIVYIDNVRLGILLRKVFPLHPFVHSKLPLNLRRQVLDLLKSGEITRIMCSDVWSDGLDIPSLDYFIDCSVQRPLNLIIPGALGAASGAEDKAIGNYIMFLCLASEHLFNHGIRKLQSIGKMGWEVRYMFDRSVTDAFRFEQIPLLPELGTFPED